MTPPPPRAPGAIRRHALLTWTTALAGGLAFGAAGSRAADLPALAAASKPSIVAVGTYNALDSPRFTFRGTGFVVADGSQVVTNHHVLPGADLSASARLVVMVPQPGGAAPQLRDAQVRNAVPEHDLALLSISGSPLPALSLSDGPLARDGQDVAFIGFPLGSSLGLTPVIHRGIVSAVSAVALPSPTSRQLDAKTAARLRAGPFDIYQLDATAYPGNSGSPLFDVSSGQVLGIVNMVFIKGTKESAMTAPSGISYAIPSRHILSLLQSR